MKTICRRAVGVLTIGGGGAGALNFAQLPFGAFPITVWLLNFSFIAICCWGIACGVRLLERGDATFSKGILAFWLLQVPLLSSSLLTYFFSVGANFSVYLHANGVASYFLLGSGYKFYALVGPEPLNVGINLVALAVCGVMLWDRAKHAKRTRQNDNATSTTA